MSINPYIIKSTNISKCSNICDEYKKIRRKESKLPLNLQKLIVIEYSKMLNK